MTISKIKEFLEANGWVDLGEQKSPYMISFKKEETEIRMNIYTTTMTITLQSPTTRIRSHRDVDSMERLEEIINI